jgi:2Fe-2S ferredoxin
MIDVPDGWSLMQAAVTNGVEGFEAACAGCCACSTCHCYIDDAYLNLLEPPSETEMAMLENVAAELRRGSRLACQIKSHPGLNGLVVRIAEIQSDI